MPFNERSRHIAQGVARSPNRAMYYALGYEKSDFDKPMIGIANGHSTITPCNPGPQPLSDAAAVAIKAAGANPQMFGTPTISDGMSMGTEGMKYSLVSREVIADCVEMSVQGQWMDGVLVLGGCDKNMPGGMMGILGPRGCSTFRFLAARRRWCSGPAASRQVTRQMWHQTARQDVRIQQRR